MDTADVEDSRPETHPINKAKGRFSCVVDEHPRFHLDALRWFACLTEAADVDPSDIIVHVVGPKSSDALDYLKGQGVAIRTVERFDPRSPHCNKISGALRLAEDPITGMAVLCDTDVAVLEDPRQLNLEPATVAGKVVDAPVPPLDVVLNIFVASGLAAPPTVPLPWGPGQWTVSGNNNGGLYLVPGPLLPKVASAWAHWAEWLLDRAELLEEWTVYVDQVSMALALVGENIGSTPLDVRWNTPTHDPSRIPPDAPEPAVIHYHQEVDRQGLIRLTGTASIDGRIAAVNSIIQDVWRQAGPDATYTHWLSQIAAEPEPGADPGHEEKRKIVAVLLEVLGPVSVLEVGSVDNGISQGLIIEQYIGIDPSDDAVRRARVGRPEGRFAVATLANHPAEADLTLCLEQLTRPMNTADYRELVELLWQSTKQVLVVSGYEDPRGIRDPSVQFHEPLSTTLKRVAPGAEVYPVIGDRLVPTFVVLKTPAELHPRDFVSATLAPLVGRHPDPLSLAVLHLHARRTTGFYPDHAPRLWEYPVVAQLVEQNLPAGSRLVDVGAGVTPLTPFLTSRGYVVDTVDPSRTTRVWPPRPDWNEWDFLDYGAAGLAHRSWNCNLSDLPIRRPFDGLYSISVIEHIPATDRRALVADISARTRLGGLVVLTIDLARESDDLWNRNLGVEVEIPAIHGSLQDVIDECAAVGLEMFRDEVIRDWGETEVDIALLAMRQTRAPAARRWHDARRGLVLKVRRS